MFNFAYGPIPDIVLEPGFLERLREAFPTGEPIAGIPGGAGAERFPGGGVERPPLPGDPGYDPTLPPGYMEPSLFEDQEGMDAYGNIHFTNKEPIDEYTGILEPERPVTDMISGGFPAIPPPGMGNPSPTGDPPPGTAPGIAEGIASLMPAVEEEKYKKYIASDTNPFESMGVSSLGQNALRQMIFERANPSVNQQKNYKSYIG